jgi:hypothetical protein
MRTILEAAWETAAMPRAEAHDNVHYLGHWLSRIQHGLAVPLVTEVAIIQPFEHHPRIALKVEQGVDVVGALYNLLARGERVYRPATDHTPRHRGSHENMEAFILADRVAAGVVGAYEITRGEPVSLDDQNQLAVALADFRLREPHMPAEAQLPRHARIA